MAKKAQGTKPERKRVSLADRERIQRLTLMNNDFMNVCLDGDIPCAQEMLEVILNRKDLTVKTVKAQYYLQGVRRSVRLDILAVDEQNARYNIEIENVSERASPRRVRFQGASIDVHSLEAGQDFEDLPERYVIFITPEDALGHGKLIYVIHKYIDGMLIPFDDGSHIIYINASTEDDGSELWKLVHDLRCANPDEMYFPRLAARARFFKQTEEGLQNMSNVFDEIRQEAAAEAEARAEARAKQEKENFVLGLLKLGKLTLEEIAECSGLSMARVRKLAQTLM